MRGSFSFCLEKGSALRYIKNIRAQATPNFLQRQKNESESPLDLARKLTVVLPNNLVLHVPCRPPIIPVCGRTYHAVCLKSRWGWLGAYKNETFSANLNVINNGLIPTLPPGAAVEVPCLVNGCGIFPCRIENYPEQLASLNRGMINAQILGAEGALACDRHKIFQAIACDPLTAATLGLDEIQAMTNDLFDALKDYIDPRFSK